VHLDDDLETKLHDLVRDDLERRAINVETTMKRLLVIHGTGRIYTQLFRRKNGRLYVFGRRVPHQASAPGMPPATDTGRLLGSIHHTVGDDADGQYAHIGSDVEYALYLELGTRYMAPRPFMRPALDAATLE
jgi:HK97 gp10 family phage protein